MLKKKQEKKADPLKEIRSRISKAPTKPGIYRWIGKNDEVLYVGKAKNLKSRLKSYVQKDPDITLGPWKLTMLRKITDVDWTITETELEALILETNLIKDLKPKYNVLMKDDKSYVYVKVNVQDAYPSVEVVRHSQMGNEEATKKPRYFGPFLSSGHIKRILDILHDVYGFRACKRSLDAFNKQPRHAERNGAKQSGVEGQHCCCSTQYKTTGEINLKPCLDSQIGRCNGLCRSELTREEYNDRIESVMRFFRGNRKGVIERLEEKMRQSAERKLFEQAAKLRDTLEYIKSLEAQQIVSDTTGANTDVFGIAMLAEKAHVVVLRERGGRVVGERSYSLAGQADAIGEVLTQFIPQYYTSTGDVPDTVICPGAPDGKETLEEWLTNKKNRKVVIRIPERGKKSKLLKMSEENAEEKIKQHLAKWEAATQKVEDALTELKKKLKLKDKPKRIECFDISHHGGTETVGSMSVFINGKAKNEHYRSFTIRTIKKGVIDDCKSLKEVLQRRLRYVAETLQDEEKRWNRHGIQFGKIRKKEHQSVDEIIDRHPGKFMSGITRKGNFIVARNGDNIIGFGCLLAHPGEVVELKSIWADEEHRDQKLRQFISKKLVSRVKKGKIYITINPRLEEHYAQIGFRYIQKPPKILKNEIGEGEIVMVYIVSEHKADVSLNSRSDLLVLDGGKGQLSAGVEVLKSMKLDIPIIGLAKREEEVFVPGNSNPIPFKKNSEGLFLLMRLRDEAHRFANWQREKKARKGLTG